MIRKGKVHHEVSVRPLRTAENVTTEEKPEISEDVAKPADDAPETAAKPKPATAKPAGTAREYTVVSGDTLTRISKKMYGTTQHWRKIQDANPGKVGSRGQIRVGVTLTIPAIGGN